MTTRTGLVIALLLCATLGLAPYAPEPHVVEKLRLLFQGNLSRAIDIFDLALHGAPWLILLVVVGLELRSRRA